MDAAQRKALDYALSLHAVALETSRHLAAAVVLNARGTAPLGGQDLAGLAMILADAGQLEHTLADVVRDLRKWGQRSEFWTGIAVREIERAENTVRDILEWAAQSPDAAAFLGLRADWDGTIIESGLFVRIAQDLAELRVMTRALLPGDWVPFEPVVEWEFPWQAPFLV